MTKNNERNVFIFPGQGSQYNQMFKKLYKKYDFVKKIFKTSDDILGYDIQKIANSKSNKKLN